MSPIEILAALLLLSGTTLVLHALVAADRTTPASQESEAPELIYRKAA